MLLCAAFSAVVPLPPVDKPKKSRSADCTIRRAGFSVCMGECSVLLRYHVCGTGGDEKNHCGDGEICRLRGFYHFCGFLGSGNDLCFGLNLDFLYEDHFHVVGVDALDHVAGIGVTVEILGGGDGDDVLARS